jgi:hypothetical protein
MQKGQKVVTCQHSSFLVQKPVATKKKFYKIGTCLLTIAVKLRLFFPGAD